jgi:hypothetical protein
MKTLKGHGIALPFQPVPTKMPDIWENAKLEQVICTGLKPQYNESLNELIPTQH